MLEIEPFREWLRERKGSTFRAWWMDRCPLALYLTERSGTPFWVATRSCGHVGHAGQSVSRMPRMWMPEWACRFVSAVDSLGVTHVPGYVCLALLEGARSD